MGSILPLLVQIVEAVIANAPQVIADIRLAINGAPITAEQKADLHARLDAAGVRVAAVTFSGDDAAPTPQA